MLVTRIDGRTPPHGVSHDPAVVVAATEVRGGGKEGASPARSLASTSPSTSTRSSGRRRDPRLPRLPLGRGCPPEMGSSAHKEVVGLPNKLRLALSPPSKDNKAVDGVLVGVDLRIELFVPSSRSADSGTVPGGGRPRRGRSCRQLHLQPIHRCTSSWTGVPNLLPGIDFH